MSKELFKEAIKVLKAVKSTDIEISEVQVYLTTDDGEIMELCIGYDEDGELRKTMDKHDSAEEMHEVREEQENEMTENVLLN